MDRPLPTPGPGSRSGRGRRCRGWWLSTAVASAFVITLAGCQRTVARQGGHGVRADWEAPTLTARLEDPIRATDVAAAGEVALKRMGYAISERVASDDRSIVVGLAPGGSRFDRIVIRAEPVVRDTRVEITTRIRPDEDRARIVFDEMLVLLGR